jgi:hypothetical protein
MHAMEGPFKVFLDLGKFPVKRRKARHHDVIVVGKRKLGSHQPDRSLEPAADPIANDRPAKLLGDGKAEPGAFAGCARSARVGGNTRPRFQNERGRRKPRAPSKSQKFRSFLERFDRHDDASNVGANRRAARERAAD